MSGEELLHLSWQRLRWEALSDPFQVADPFFHMNVRRFELETPPSLTSVTQGSYRPGDGFDLTLVRGARIRRQRALEVADYLLLVRCLSRCQEALRERLRPLTDTFGLAEGEHSVEWIAAPAQPWPIRQAELLRRHRWWLAVEVANCFETLDYRRLALELGRLGLERAWVGALLSLFRRHAQGPRQGVISCGRVNHLLTRLALQPVVEGLAREGCCYALTGLDDFHVFLDSRAEGLAALECLTRLLATQGLHVNHARSWLVETSRARAEQARARWRWDYLRHRLAAWGARAGWPVAGWLEPSLENALFVHRRPAFRELLAWPATQEAFWRRLRRPDRYFGDRALLLLALAWSPQRPRGRLREHLLERSRQSGLTGRLHQIALDGLEPSGSRAG